MNTTFQFSSRTVASLFFACLFCLALTLLSGCGGGSSSSAFAGRWEAEESYADVGNYSMNGMELLKDGTGILTHHGREFAITSWKTENGRLYITVDTYASAWNYTLSGSTLTLEDEFKYKYKKK